MSGDDDRPVDGSAWWRTGAGVLAWLALAVAASGAAWAAVAVVGDQEAVAPIEVTTSGGTDGAAGAGGPSGATHTPEEQSARPATRTLTSPGGTVTVACVGADSVRLVAAVSNPGWQRVREETGPHEVEIEFERDDGDDWRIRARCRDGVIDAGVDD